MNNCIWFRFHPAAKYISHDCILVAESNQIKNYFFYVLASISIKIHASWFLINIIQFKPICIWFWYICQLLLRLADCCCETLSLKSVAWWKIIKIVHIGTIKSQQERLISPKSFLLERLSELKIMKHDIHQAQLGSFCPRCRDQTRAGELCALDITTLTQINFWLSSSFSLFRCYCFWPRYHGYHGLWWLENVGDQHPTPVRFGLYRHRFW